MTIDLAPHNPNGLSLQTPVLAASGSMGYGVEYVRRKSGGRADPAMPELFQGLGALVTRTTTLHPQRGNQLPRIIETTAGILYTGEAHNPGLRHVLRRYAPAWSAWDLPVIMSVAGEDAQTCAEIGLQLEGVAGVAGIELNLAACGLLVSTTAASAIAAVRAVTLLPLLVKLPPEAPDIVALARACGDAGADALALVSGIPGMVVDPDTGTQITGRLCGPAIRPLALSAVAAVVQAVTIPVIGIGGIASSSDAHQYLAVGAQAVGIGAALLTDPRIAGRVGMERISA